MNGIIKLINKDCKYGIIESNNKAIWMSLIDIDDNLQIGDNVSFDEVENGRFDQAINIKKV